MKLTNKQRSYIISECKKRIIKESLMNDIGYLWNFLDGEKPNFISYMETSGNLPYNDEEDY